MEITVDKHTNVDVVTVSGRIDGSNAGDLDGSLKGLNDEGRHQIVLDLSGIEYMSSAGLRAMVSALREARKNKGDVRIAQPSERMAEVLSLAGLDTVFSIYDDTVAGVGSFT